LGVPTLFIATTFFSFSLTAQFPFPNPKILKKKKGKSINMGLGRQKAVCDYSPLDKPQPPRKQRHTILALTKRKFVLALFFFLVLGCFALNSAMNYGLMVLISRKGFQLDLSLAMLSMRCSPTNDSDEYCLPKLSTICRSIPADHLEDFFPVAENFTSTFAPNLCAALQDVADNFRTFAIPLPSDMTNHGALSDNYNRGYLVPEYLLHWFTSGPFTTLSPANSSAVLLPLALEPQHSLTQLPFSIFLNLFAPKSPGGNYRPWFQLHRSIMFAKALQLEEEKYPELLNQHQGRDHFVLGTGTEYTLPSARDSIITVCSDSDVSTPPAKTRFNVNKDVAIVSSISFWLPMYAQRGFDPKVRDNRHLLYFFSGGFTHTLRRVLLRAHQESGYKSGVVRVGEHLSQDEYVDYQLASKFCFHVRGSRGWSPRLFEVSQDFEIVDHV
jgi:hypothetical protein